MKKESRNNSGITLDYTIQKRITLHLEGFIDAGYDFAELYTAIDKMVYRYNCHSALSEFFYVYGTNEIYTSLDMKQIDSLIRSIYEDLITNHKED